METIFERDFYPTPQQVIETMLQGHSVTGKVVLEPSAGSGNIVDYLQNNYVKEVIACEVNSKLRSIVASKCEVIADDFLTVTSEMVSHIDMIVMNPPFSNARKHILHAYEIAPEGCEIISLCNATDMSDNKYRATTDQLKLHELVSYNGYSEMLGNVFSDAERRTDVDIACIHLYKPKSGESEFEDYMFSTIDEQDHGSTEGLIEYNLVRDVVNRYCEAVKTFDSVMAMSESINDLTSIFRGPYDRDCMFGCFDKESGSKITRERYKKEMQKLAWRFIIDKMNMTRFATSKVYKQINAFVERQQHIPFTMKNVYQMIYMIVATQGNRMETALIEAFDHICSFSSENSTAGEKWKTNANYMVNKKFIVPDMFTYEHYRTKEPYVCLNLWRNRSESKIHDVCIALEYISGKKEGQDVFEYIRRNNLEWGEWHEYGGFFRFKAFKKGTMHLEFLDEDIWALFNQRVAEIRGWELPKKSEKKRK